MPNTLRLMPHESLKLLQNGKKVMCKKCKESYMIPKGDPGKTNTFYCEKCGSQIIIN